MDTSKEYIKMCEKAVEIQKLRIKQRGDYLIRPPSLFIQSSVDPRDYSQLYIKNLGVADDIEIMKLDEVWLPRQDQLQDMIEAKSYTGVLCFFNIFIKTKYDKGSTLHNPQFHFGSMEQLWLAFVMKEKYQKVWDGENWVKDGK